MKCIGRKFCVVLSLVGLMVAAVALPVRAAQPAVVVELESIRALIGSVTVVSKALGQEAPEPAMITGALGGMLKVPGLAGVDTTQSVQLYVFLPKLNPAAKEMDPAAMVPRIAFVLPLQGDGKVYASAVTSMFPKSETIGAVKHFSDPEQPGQDVFVTVVAGRAAVSDHLETVQNMRKILSEQPATTAVVAFPGTVRVRLDIAACTPFVKAASAQTLAMISAQEMPPEVTMDPAKMLEAEMDGLLMLMRELRSYTLGIKISPTAITLCDRITPMSGTKTATWISGMKPPASMYMKAIPENAMLASVGSGMGVMDLMAEPYADLMGKIYDAMGAPMNQMGPLMREMMLSMKGVYGDDIAIGIVPAPSGKGVGFIEMIALADSAKAKKIVQDMITGFNDDWGKAMPGFTLVELPARQHNGVDVQAFSYKFEAVTNQPTASAVPAMPAMPMTSMKWMEGLRWEMAFVDDHLMYTCGAAEIMDAALDRLKAGGTRVDETSAFTTLFPSIKGNVVEVHTLSLCRTLKGLLSMIPGIDPSVLEVIPDDTAGMAGYSMAKGGNLISIDRISLGEITAIQKAIPALAGTLPALMQQFGIPGAPGQPGGMPGQPGMDAMEMPEPTVMDPGMK